jgi:predicted phosphodiesterase
LSKNKSYIVNQYLDKFPNTKNLTLAKMIYNENKLLFKNLDSVRGIIRYYKGSKGKRNLKEILNDKYLTLKKRIEKYNLPESIETEYVPYSMTGNKGLIFSDVHIPFHSISAIETMFNYTIDMNLDFILLNGDIMDMFDISHFAHEPDLVRIKDEFSSTKQFLLELKRIYPKAKIYFKSGNHELRWETYLMKKAPEIFGMPQFKLEILLDLYNMGIEYIPENLYIDLSGLYIYHGHEFKNAITSPANPARTAFLRSKDCAIVGHYHQVSEHTEKSINDKIITCWSLGCLSDLHPKFMPLNKWSHGFAIYERHDKNFWTIENKRIISNRVV